jgi:hypothetical protein
LRTTCVGNVPTEPALLTPTVAFRIEEQQDRSGFSRVGESVPGYSGLAHYIFFRGMIENYEVRSILMLGVYMGRDIAMLLDIARSRNISLKVVGVDKFSDDFCADWPAEVRHLTWQEVGFGTAPTIERTSENLVKQGLGACQVQLVKGHDADYLAGCQEQFDMIFIDTSHDYETVMRQIRDSRRLLKPEGFMTGDDYSDKGSWGVTQAVTESFDHHWVVDSFIWLAQPAAEVKNRASRAAAVAPATAAKPVVKKAAKKAPAKPKAAPKTKAKPKPVVKKTTGKSVRKTAEEGIVA